MSVDWSRFSTALADSPVEHVEESHPRFMQIAAHLDGTHPRVVVGQVWEDINPDNFFRRILVDRVRNDGITECSTVWVNNLDDEASVGEYVEIPTYSFRIESEDSGYRLRGAYISFDDAGVPHNLSAVPVAKPLNALVKTATPPRRAATTNTKDTGNKPVEKPVAKDTPTDKVAKQTTAVATIPTNSPESKTAEIVEENTAVKNEGIDIGGEQKVASVTRPFSFDFQNDVTVKTNQLSIAKIVSDNDSPSVFHKLIARVSMETLGTVTAFQWARSLPVKENPIPNTGTASDISDYRNLAHQYGESLTALSENKE